MSRSKRSNGSGTVFIKHGSYYGRWVTPTGGRTNRKLGPVRRPGRSHNEIEGTSASAMRV